MKNILLVIFLSVAVKNIHAQKKSILIVSTNRDSVGSNVSGTFLRELAYPFQYFIEKGYDVDIVTTNGGKAAIYHWGETPASLEQTWKSELFTSKTNHTLSPAQVVADNYTAIFFPGGHGQYFDVVNDERIADLAALIYENGGVVGTAGHGAASLINIRLSNGKFLVDGKRITCFPQWAELAYMNISNYGKLIAFDMEEVLRRRGAELVICTKETRPNPDYTQVTDAKNRMVTGAFAGSARWVAEQMVSLIESKRNN